jgi:hypothetical protein
MMMTGALIAGAGDVSWDPLGYLLVLINNIFTAAYLSLIKKVSRETNLVSHTRHTCRALFQWL